MITYQSSASSVMLSNNMRILREVFQHDLFKKKIMFAGQVRF